jgi:hypothetical protein
MDPDPYLSKKLKELKEILENGSYLLIFNYSILVPV